MNDLAQKVEKLEKEVALLKRDGRFIKYVLLIVIIIPIVIAILQLLPRNF